MRSTTDATALLPNFLKVKQGYYLKYFMNSFITGKIVVFGSSRGLPLTSRQAFSTSTALCEPFKEQPT